MDLALLLLKNGVLYIFLFLYVFVMPGFLCSIKLFKNLDIWERLAISLSFGILVLPIVNFSIAWLFNTSVSIWLVLISTSLIICVLLVLVLKDRNILKKMGMEGMRSIKIHIMPLINLKNTILFITLISIFFFSMINFEGPAQDYWSTYITAPAMHIANDKIDFVDIDGNLLYDYNLKGKIPQNLIDEENFGLISKDQRIGGGIIFSLPYVLFGLGGFALFYSLINVISFIFIFSTFRHISHSEKTAFFSAFIAVINPITIYFNRLNANMIALMIISLLFFLIIKKKSYFIAGIAYGILGGVRNVALIFSPAILVYFYLTNKSNKKLIKNISYFVIGAVIFILPILLWKSFAFGSIIAHPTQYDGLYGHRPEFDHNILGLDFRFNGMLNYPFIDKMVRTPHFPFPNYITIPLLLMRSFGFILTSFAILGIIWSLVDKKKSAILMIFIMLPFMVFLMVQENWEELKSSFVIMVLPSFVYFINYGIDTFLRECLNLYKHAKKKINRMILKPIVIRCISLIIIFTLIASSIPFLKSLEFQKDERWYERFPHSQTCNISALGLSEELRSDWQFFYHDETYSEYITQKEKYLNVGLFPKMYTKVNLNVSSVRGVVYMVGKRNLKTLEVWNYIYG